MKQFLLLLLWVPLFAGAYPLHPNPETTPGDRCTEQNPDFSEFRYDEHIPYCDRNVSTSLKKAIYKAYGIPVAEQKDYTIDHLLPLSMGGSNSVKNLWPENKKVKALRPDLEQDLYYELADAKTTQDEALKLIQEAKADPCHYTGFDAVPDGSDACAGVTP